MNMLIMPEDYYRGSRTVPCPLCGKHNVTAEDSKHFEPGMGLGVLTTFGPCTSPAAHGEVEKK